ncbi:MAG: hypothetical protein NTZ78_03980 [Candidatus Aureabacteria bacterium]|nr:hypothetical protein [Candidatus Auribacterota bacterium]
MKEKMFLRQAAVVTIGELIDIMLKILPAHMMICTVDGSLELRPETLYGIDMDISVYILLFAMLYYPMFISVLACLIVNRKIIRHERGTFSDIALDNRHDRGGLHVFCNPCFDIPLALDYTDNWSFALCSSASFPFTLAADVGLIDFDDSGQLTAILRHELSDLLLHTPCRLVGNSDVSLDLLTGYAIAGLAHKEDRIEPTPERCRGFVKYRTRYGMKLISAPRTYIALAGTHAIETALAAFRTCVVTAISFVKDMLKANIIIGEVFVELFYRVFHGFPPYCSVTRVANPLNAVKG